MAIRASCALLFLSLCVCTYEKERERDPQWISSGGMMLIILTAIHQKEEPVKWFMVSQENQNG